MATKTRRNGEGSIRQRPDGKWEFRLKGKSYYFATEKEAVKEGRKIAQRAETCDLSSDKLTFDALASAWFSVKKRTTKTATWQTYEYAMSRLVDKLGKKKVSTLKKSDFQAVLNEMAPEYSLEYIDKVRAVANNIMGHALDDEIIARNPAAKCTIPSNAKTTEDKKPYSEDEVDRLLQSLPEIPWGDMAYLMLVTGMRGQELCALGKDCLVYIDGQCYLSVHQAMSRTGGAWVLSQTKSESGKRKIPLGKTAETLIKKRMIASPSDHLFVNRAGGIINYSTFRKLYTRSVEAVEGVECLPPHSCRHTFATRLYKNKVDAATAQKLLGHAAYDTTIKIYTHISDQDLAGAMEF